MCAPFFVKGIILVAIVFELYFAMKEQSRKQSLAPTQVFLKEIQTKGEYHVQNTSRYGLRHRFRGIFGGHDDTP